MNCDPLGARGGLVYHGDCALCGKPFSRPRRKVSGSSPRYCSRECFRSAQRIKELSRERDRQRVQVSAPVLESPEGALNGERAYISCEMLHSV